jgi:Protein of unknown function (DUF1524)
VFELTRESKLLTCAVLGAIALTACKPTTATHNAAASSATPTVSAVATPLAPPPASTVAPTASAPPPVTSALDTSAPPTLTASQSAQQVASEELTQLASLLIKGRAPMTGYTRAQFGPAWPTESGCDARNVTLRRDLSHPSLLGSCTVETGTLVSPYTGQSIAFVRGPNSAIVQIDHVVALGDAWQTGAQSWTAAKREQFANDESELLAVDGRSNEQKGDADAASWLPPNKAFRCEYVGIQVTVKVLYRLWVTQAEHDAIANVLVGCGATPIPRPPGLMPTAQPAPTPTEVVVVPTPTKTAPPAPAALSCVATLSDSFPKHNETVHVYVQTSRGAQLTVTAVYKSKDTVHTGSADATGAADVPFDIASATYGFVVDVNVTVSAAGATARCATSFTPMSP